MNRLVVDRLTVLRHKKLWVAWQFVYDTNEARDACAVMCRISERERIPLNHLRLRRVTSEVAAVNAKREIEDFWRNR